MSLEALCKDVSEKEIMKTLKSIFDEYTEKLDLSKIQDGTPHATYDSHTKFLIEKQNTPLGELVFELILFKEGKNTGPHIHPRFMLDKIIEGELQETLFTPCEGGYQREKIVSRKHGENRAICCPHCFPHDVKAINGNCLSLSMTLGEQDGEYIDVV